MGGDYAEQMLLKGQVGISGEALGIRTQGCEEGFNLLLHFWSPRCIDWTTNNRIYSCTHVLLPLSQTSGQARSSTLSSLWKAPILIWQTSLSFWGEENLIFVRKSVNSTFVLYGRIRTIRLDFESAGWHRLAACATPSLLLAAAGRRDDAIHAKVFRHLAVVVKSVPGKNGRHAQAGGGFIPKGTFNRLNHVFVVD